MITVRLYLLRHGEPHQEPDGGWMFYGHHDVGLSTRGRGQALAQVEMLRHVPLRGVYSSDLERTKFTARALARDHGLEHRQLPELREMHLGVLEGVTLDNARIRHPELVSRRYEDMLDWRMPEGGESVRDVHGRVMPCLGRLVARHVSDAEPGGTVAIAVVAHNTVNRIVLAEVAGAGPAGYASFRQHPGAINRVDLFVREDHPPSWQESVIAFTNIDPHTTRTGQSGRASSR